MNERRAALLLLHHHAPILHVHAIAVAVLARREEIVVPLDDVAHDFAARLALQRDDRGQVLALLGIIRGQRVQRDACGKDNEQSMHGLS